MEPLPQHRPTTGAAKRTAGRRVRRRQPPKPLSDIPAAPAFLKHCFLPLVADHPVLCASRRVRGEFFRSVDNLAWLYQLVLPDSTDLPYPLSIHASYCALKQQLEKDHRSLSLAILQTDAGVTTLATVKPVDLHATLYYVPLLPIFNMQRRAKARSFAPILLGVASFIRQKMGIPSYAEWGSYIADVYHILEQWVDDTDAERDEQEAAEYYRAFRQVEKVGYVLHRKMRQPARITKLPSYLLAFEPVNEWQARLRTLAEEILTLDRAFPNRCLFKEIPTGLLDEEAEDEDRVTKGQYLSFVHDVDGWLGEEMIDYVETALQDCLAVDAPVTVQYFSEPQMKECHDPTYEGTCLRLLHEFVYLLNNIDYDQY